MSAALPGGARSFGSDAKAGPTPGAGHAEASDTAHGSASASVPAPVRAFRRVRRPSPGFRHERRDWLRRRLSILLAEAMTWTVGVMPGPVRDWIADRAGDLWHRAAPTYRGNVRENLRQVLGAARSERELDDIVRRVFRLNARNFCDLFAMPHWTRRGFDRRIRIEDWGVLERALQSGSGVVLVTGHLGAFDVVGQAIAVRGLPLTVMTGKTTTRFIFDAVNHLRQTHGPRVVEATPGGVRAAITALRNNETAAFLADFDFFRNGLPVHLFGRETTLPPGPIRLARDTGAQVVGAFAERCRDGYRLTLTTPFAVERTRDLDADLAAGMHRLAGLLEQAIAAMPEQWVILQRVWPEAPADPVRIFPEGSPLESGLLRRVDDLLPPRLPGER
ncbi:MAG: lysophospholipid acyltransferase family protein [Chloroflexota bacterium]